jgi:hypothetical protein
MSELVARILTAELRTDIMTLDRWYIVRIHWYSNISTYLGTYIKNRWEQIEIQDGAKEATLD